jgi:hypothetical protein
MQQNRRNRPRSVPQGHDHGRTRMMRATLMAQTVERSGLEGWVLHLVGAMVVLVFILLRLSFRLAIGTLRVLWFVFRLARGTSKSLDKLATERARGRALLVKCASSIGTKRNIALQRGGLAAQRVYDAADVAAHTAYVSGDMRLAEARGWIERVARLAGVEATSERWERSQRRGGNPARPNHGTPSSPGHSTRASGPLPAPRPVEPEQEEAGASPRTSTTTVAPGPVAGRPPWDDEAESTGCDIPADVAAVLEDDFDAAAGR